ncbi:MAG: molybdopterin-binding protein [Methylococcales bacterium]
MSNPRAEIFSQGEEVITGQVADTNAAWLSDQLVNMGFNISRHTAVGDKLPDLEELLKEISLRADICICTGGLGPTIDDLTAEAVANAFNRPLQLDSTALTQIESYFFNRQKKMADINQKQAFFPKGSIRIDNAWGTAPGFAVLQNRCWFVFLPGVPTEMRNMFRQHISKQLQQRFVLQAEQLFVIKSIGMGESDLQQKINDFALPENVQLSFRATAEEVQTKLLFPANAENTACVSQLIDLIGDAVFTCDKPAKPAVSFIQLIDQLMTEKKFTLAVQETATQGLISAKCIGYDWLTYASYQPFEQAENTDYIKIAADVAHKLKHKNKTDLVLVQLYQGDKTQFLNKKQSIVIYNVLLTPEGIFQNSHILAGPVKRKQNQAALRALDLLRRFLQNKCH